MEEHQPSPCGVGTTFRVRGLEAANSTHLSSARTVTTTEVTLPCTHQEETPRVRVLHEAATRQDRVLGRGHHSTCFFRHAALLLP